MILIVASPEPFLLIEQISMITGERAEVVVTIAVREHLDSRDEAEAELKRRAEAYALVKELGAMFREAEITAVDHGELLYDEDGLPK